MKTTAGIGCLGILVVLIISAAVGAICWTYAINSWLEFAQKPARIVWWQGALIGFCPAVGQLSIPAAVLTFIVMLFIA